MLRRGFIGGLVGLLAAPAIIRTPGLLMPVKSPIWPVAPLALVNRATGVRTPIPVTRDSDIFAAMAQIAARKVLYRDDRYVFECSREIRFAMDVQVMHSKNVLLQSERYSWHIYDSYRGIPILLAGELV